MRFSISIYSPLLSCSLSHSLTDLFHDSSEPFGVVYTEVIELGLRNTGNLPKIPRFPEIMVGRLGKVTQILQPNTGLDPGIDYC